MKRKIYLNEYNIPTGNSIYLPYSSGLLQAYAQQINLINENYEFTKIFFQRDTVDNIVAQYDSPDVVGFSVSMWNYQLSLAVAGKIKEKFPNCLIVFGGPSITKTIELSLAYPFIDHCVYREGEIVFCKILESILCNDLIHCTLYDKVPQKDLDIFPSPYTTDIFTDIISAHPELEFKAIIETNRNCPFNCAFCYWGSNDIDNKIRYHSLDYLKEEFEWIAKNKIKYVFCADANFGMYKRDVEIAQTCSDIKEKYGYPEKFRVCYGKNATKNIFETAKILSKSNLAKTVTLSVQSFNQEVLNNINRKNIKVEQFQELQKQYDAEGIPTYTEIILGLPGETYQSFIKGLESAIRLTKNNQLFIYHCQILNNTLLANKKYKQKYGIKTISMPLSETHITARPDNFIQEFDEIIIETNTMSTTDWMICTVTSWIVQLFYSLKIGNQITDWLVDTYNINYMDFYEYLTFSHMTEIHNLWNMVKQISQGKPRCQIDERFGKIYYDPEELAYLQIVCDQKRFYLDLQDEVINFLYSSQTDTNWESINLSELFEQQQKSLPNPNDFDSLEDFAVQTILYGRKNNKIAPQASIVK